MRFLILGGLVLLLAAATNNVRAHAAGGYPYHSSLLAYSPARGEFPIAQGYIRYFDASGAENLIGYNYPVPATTRRLSSGDENNDAAVPAADKRNPLLRTSNTEQLSQIEQQHQHQQESLSKTREDHFRAWCEQRYRALKAEIDKIRAEGKQPSYDLMAQIKPLEKIMASISAATAEMSPEIKYAREEHLRIWNEARLKVAQQEREQLKLNEGSSSNSYKQQPISTQLQPAAELQAKDQMAAIEETAEQKKAREEHLRSYQAQLALIQQLEAQRLELLSQRKEEKLPQPEAVTKTIVSADLKEVTPTTLVQQESSEEHLKRLNEAENNNNKQYESNLKLIPKPEETDQLTLQPVKETAEVMRAREEHLKLVQEAQRRAQAAESSYSLKQADKQTNHDDDGLYRPSQAETYIPAATLLKTNPGIRQPIQAVQQAFLYIQANPAQIEYTPEVKRAREEHLRLVDEAKLKAQIETDKIDQTATTYTAIEIDAENEEERLLKIESLREAERIRAEAQMREEERLREAERLLEEQRLMASELLRLQKEEQQRMELEQRLADASTKQGLKETKILNEPQPEDKEQQQHYQIGQQLVKSYGAYIPHEQQKPNPFLMQLPQGQKPIAVSTHEQQKPNPYLPQAQKPVAVSTHDQQKPNPYLPQAQKPILVSANAQQKPNPFLVQLTKDLAPNAYYTDQYLDEPPNPEFPRVVYYPTSAGAVAAAANLVINPENQFLIHYQQQQQQTRPELIKYLDSPAAEKQSESFGQKSELKPIEADQEIGTTTPDAGYISPSASSMKIDGQVAGLSELEKATREHFRAHELALEQLQLANSRKPYTKDC